MKDGISNKMFVTDNGLVVITNKDKALKIGLTILFLFVASLSFGQVSTGGWADGVTGGYGCDTVTVSDSLSFRAAVGPTADTDCRTVLVSGSFNIGYCLVGSNKTIIGLEGATVTGTIRIQAATNVIVQGLTVTVNGADLDAIAIHSSTYVWIDHCTIFNWTDGAIDIVKGSNYVTLSWNRMYWTEYNVHSLAVLIGADPADPDAGLLKTTLHHNWFDVGIQDRTPRVRFGQVHVYNNYMASDAPYIPKVGAYITAGEQADIRSENNYFENGEDPLIYKETGGIMISTGDFFSKFVVSVVIPDDLGVFVPPYSYSLQTPLAARNDIIAGAGVQASYPNVCEYEPPVDPPVELPVLKIAKKYKIVSRS
jgi:pectate lyase